MRVIYIGTKYNERGTALRDVHPDEIVMIVDMDRCIGCGACRLGCQAEHGDAFTAPVRRIGMCHINNKPTKLLALTRRAIWDSLARDLGHLVLVFSSCWHSICKAPEIFLRGFFIMLRVWDTAAPSTAGAYAMTASKRECTGIADTSA